MNQRPRPRIHFAPKSGWMNDPNGLIQHNGYFHLFYQCRELGDGDRRLKWGHARSADLLHWEDLPIALEPTPGGPDQDGCFSGCATVHGEEVWVLYTGVHGARQRPCLARASDADLLHLEKCPENPVIAEPPVPIVAGFRDHTLREEDGVIRQLVGSGTPESGGCVFEYRSKDLLAWEYVGVFSDSADTGVPGTMWECPDLFMLEGSWHLIISTHTEHPNDVWYLSGQVSPEGFAPFATGRMDLGARWYAPQSFTADDGRRIVFGWLREHEEEVPQDLASRVGVMSLPREYVTKANGALGMRPCRELLGLRQQEFVPVSGDGDTARIDVGHLQALEVVVEDPGGSGDLVIELTDGANTRVAVASLSGDRAAIGREPRGGERDPRASGAVRLFFDSGVCELFTPEGGSCSEVIYGGATVSSVSVRLVGADRPLPATAVVAYELASVWDRV